VSPSPAPSPTSAFRDVLRRALDAGWTVTRAGVRLRLDGPDGARAWCADAPHDPSVAAHLDRALTAAGVRR
jgi:hypothetical protein